MGKIRIGIGGWTFEPWRGAFYPKGLPQKDELRFAAQALTSIEINGTYYSTFKPPSWRKWREETPDDFVFAVKASRYATNRKILAEGAAAIEKFLAQGLTELGPKLGPIAWQFMPAKKFDAPDFESFLALLPGKQDGVPLRHALEVRHPSFECKAFYDLARKYRAAIIHAEGKDYPSIDEATTDFTYARLMTTQADAEQGLSALEIGKIAKEAKAWGKRGDVFLYFISGAKERNPAAAQALIAELGKSGATPNTKSKSGPAA